MAQESEQSGQQSGDSPVIVGGCDPGPARDRVSQSLPAAVFAGTAQEFLDLSVAAPACLSLYLATGQDGTGANLVARLAAARARSLIVAQGDWIGVRPVSGLEHGVCPSCAPRLGREPGASFDRLSPREREALAFISAGFTHGQTARRMGVAKATVDTFVARIRAKLGAGNKADLTRIAISSAGADEM